MNAAPMIVPATPIYDVATVAVAVANPLAMSCVGLRSGLPRSDMLLLSIRSGTSGIGLVGPTQGARRDGPSEPAASPDSEEAEKDPQESGRRSPSPSPGRQAVLIALSS